MNALLHQIYTQGFNHCEYRFHVQIMCPGEDLGLEHVAFIFSSLVVSCVPTLLPFLVLSSEGTRFHTR